MDIRPILDQINLVVGELDRSLAFYRLLGVDFGEPAGPHAAVTFPNGIRLELDEHAFAKQWNSGTPDLHAGGVVLCLSVSERDQVDIVYRRMLDAGYRSRQKPYDTFWGSRFTVITDPDGYQIGLMSPIEPDRRYWPPAAAPAGSD